MTKNIVTRQDVLDNMSEVQVNTIEEFGKKTTHVAVRMKNGFVLREFATPVDPLNYDIEKGKEICLKRIEDKIWYLLGYKLQERMHNSQDPLKATAYQMFSSDYKERFVAEYKQLSIRFERLERFLANNQNPASPEMTELMHAQLGHMDELLMILQRRAELDGIEL